MVKTLLLPAMVLLLASCNNPVIQQQPANGPSESAVADTATQQTSAPVAEAADTHEYVTTFKVKMDSLMKADIKLPPVYLEDVLAANSESANKFTTLANASNGNVKVLVNSNLVAQELEHTINTVSVPESDLLLLIDKTYSMARDIENVKASLDQIVDTIKKYKGTRLAVALYGDKNEDGWGWYEFRNFDTAYDAAMQYINTIEVRGGGDLPESVYDAVMKSLDQDFWQSTRKRNIILIGDAPPLEKPLSDYTMSDVIARAKKDAVTMNFYPIIITPTAAADISMSPTEIRKYQPLKLATALYPNPSRGHIDIGFADNGLYYVEIYNAAGEAVVSEEAYGISWGKDLTNLPNGMYIARIINHDHKFELIKFILQK